MTSTIAILDIRKKHFIKTANHYYEKPLQLVRASGSYVYDEEGREYLDAIGGIVCISAGHNHPRIKEKLKAMLENNEIQHTSVLYLNGHVTDLTKALLSEAPENINRVSFTNSGSEANELALLAARQMTGETYVINLRLSYHGGTSGALANCGLSTWKFRAQPSSTVASAVEPYCYRCPFGKKPNSCAFECAKNVENTIQTSTNGKIAAFIAEPVMGVGGFIAPPQEYFQEVVKIVHNYGGVYISDEVQTGMGRCGGALFLTKSLGIKADMITMAKGLGNGAPIGATLMSTPLAESLEGKSYFNTFGGDPYQAAQAFVTLEIIKDENLVSRAEEMGAFLTEGLNGLMKRHSLIGDVRGRGLLLGMELVKDRVSKEHATSETLKILDLCRARGLLVGKGGLKGNVLRLAPPLSITKEQCERIVTILDESLGALKA